VQQIQEKARKFPRQLSSLLTPRVECSPIKPIGPSCSLCYDSVQRNACKLDQSPVSSTDYRPDRLSDLYSSRRSRPFSFQSGTTLIDNHEIHRYWSPASFMMDLGKFWSSVISFFSLYAFGAFNIYACSVSFLSGNPLRWYFFLLCCIFVLVGCFRQCCCVFIYRLHSSWYCHGLYIFDFIADVLIMSPYTIASVMFRLWRPPGRWCIKKQW